MVVELAWKSCLLCLRTPVGKVRFCVEFQENLQLPGIVIFIVLSQTVS